MASSIVYKYPEMEKAVAEIQELAARYQSAADKFESDFLAAISSWEGESKDKMQTFIQVAVKEYIYTTVPKLLNGMAELLKANATQMQNADTQIAESIPQSLS